MRHLRPYLAWFMLVAALVVALPRTWIHECTDLSTEHLIHHEDGDHTQLTHESCPICDYAPASPLASPYVATLVAPQTDAIFVPQDYQAFATPQIRLSAERGPPSA